MPFKLSIAQLNLVMCDLAGNSQTIIHAAIAAYQGGARMVLQAFNPAGQPVPTSQLGVQ